LHLKNKRKENNMNTPRTDDELIEAFDEMFLSDKTFKDIYGKGKSGKHNG